MNWLKERSIVSLLTACATFFSVASEAKAVNANASDTCKSAIQTTSELPASFGPYKASSTKVTSYSGRVKVSASELKGEKLFLVIRMQEDKTHGFGWVRAYVNGQLVATEAQKKEGRIVAEVSQVLHVGDCQVSVMGAAYTDTAISFNIVPKDMVLAVLQSKLVGETLVTAGPFQAEGNKAENFVDTFSLSQQEASCRVILSVRASSSKTNGFGWIRVCINGKVVASEANFCNGEATIELSGKVLTGANRIEVIGAAHPGAQLGWYLTQIPRLSAHNV